MRLLGILMLAMTAGCAVGTPNRAPPVIAPPVLQTALGAIGNYRPGGSLTLRSAQDLQYIGLFAQVTRFADRIVFTPDTSGLWTVNRAGEMQDSSAQGVTASVVTALCGFVPLTTVSGSGVVHPPNLSRYSTGYSVDQDGRSRVTGLDVTGSLCVPEPGSTMSVRLTTEEDVTAGNWVLTVSRTKAHTETWDCRVGTETLPASAIGSGFRGEALTVTCAKTVDGEAIQATYAFLRDPGLYLPLTELRESTKATFRYAVEAYGP